jgi:hypothetical protein
MSETTKNDNLIKVKTCPFGCDVKDLVVWDRGRTIKCRDCGINFTEGLKRWNNRKRGSYLEIQY